ncbi:cobalamin-binding protein [Peteryoungia desertarenae]|uniref:Cobalamin-binding protein n=1 Tax=Peteryoungia desertarenae TaxID=1813451 RepID=A0ABX6QK68_9HYPH|nr:cobalamin-binding protein [Peteryoungia desertarenae]QLF68500.1 cobalamin-binding protein [Peteryoungia desertarenae]
MAAAKLSSRYEIGLEFDPAYDAALKTFREMVIKSTTRLGTLLGFLEADLPPGRPPYFKVLFIEATARQLGQQWALDRCDFIDVTIGSAKLQEVILSLSFEMRLVNPTPSTPFAAILTPPGEQHTLMPHLLGLLFDTLEWERHVLEPNEFGDPIFATTVDQADVACIGWSNSELSDELRTLVAKIRLQRKDRKLPFIVGGAAALDSIDFLVGLGIDCVCDSVYSAAKTCENYYELQRISRKAHAGGQTAVIKTNGIDWLTP